MPDEAPFRPDWVSPPGDTISELLAQRNLPLHEFANRLGCPVSVAANLVQGTVNIDMGIARQLEEIFGPSAQFWINRDAQYRRGESHVGSAQVVISDRDWLRQLPVGDMVKFGWIRPGKTTAEKIDACLNFFDVPDLKTWHETYRSMLSVAAFRTSPTFDANPSAVAAWLRWGELKSEEISCGVWDPVKFRSVLTEIRKLTRLKKPEAFLPQLTKLCAECGVALVVARAPRGCRASGATRFLSHKKAMIILSFRHLSDDQFWFTFFHEAGHLLLHGMDALFLEDDSDVTASEEQEANDFAAALLIPLELRTALLGLRASVKDILKFARTAGVSPGIVVGQLQHLGRIGPNRLNGMKRRYRWAESVPVPALSPKTDEL